MTEAEPQSGVPSQEWMVKAKQLVLRYGNARATPAADALIDHNEAHKAINDHLALRIAPQEAAPAKAMEVLAELVEGCETLMAWCVQNVNKWNFPEYDQLSRSVRRARALVAQKGQQ